MFVSKSLVKYALTAAVRDRIFLSFFLMILVGCSLSVFLGSAAVIEKDRFSLVFASGGLRIAGILSLVLFVIFFVRRSFDGKDVEFLLSRPISRVQFILSLALGFSIQAILVGLGVGGAVLGLAPHLISSGHYLWIVSSICENIIIVNVALFFAMYIPSAASACMATAGFYFLSRMIGQILGIIHSSLVSDVSPLSVVMQFISIFVPRLDLMAQTSWLLYGYDTSIGFLTIVSQGAIFTFLVVCAALLDFMRRQF